MRPADEPGRKAGADRDRDREHREIHGDDILVAAEHVLHQRRQQRQHHRADQPEPARHQRAPPQPAVAAQMLEQAAVELAMFVGDHQVGRAGADLRDEQARAPAQQREHQHQPGERRPDRRRLSRRGRRRWCRAGSPGRSRLRPARWRPAAPSFGSRSGQDAVFDRAEQRADHAEAEQRDEQDRHRVHDRSRRSRSRDDADLGELQPLRDDGLVVAVGHLAAERRQEEIRRDEHRGRRA